MQGIRVPALRSRRPDAPAARSTGRRRAAVLSAGLPLAVVVAALVALSTGPVATAPLDTLQLLLEPLRSPLAAIGLELPERGAAAIGVVWSLRLPRVVLALLVGAALAVAGAVMQAVFRNPLAEPGITGVSSGAAAAAVLLIVGGASAAAPWILPVGAFLGALATVALVQLVAGLRGGGATLLLVGISLNAFLGAVISAAIANAPSSDHAMQAMLWLHGDLTAASWRDVSLAAGPILIGTALLLLAGPELDLFLLGDEQAAASGLRTGRARHLLLALSALVTAAGVAVTGVIAFVGLVVPHLVRLVLGPEHRVLVPVSAAIGAVFLVLADLVARTLLDPVVLQTGTVTAFLGAPVLLALVLRRSAR